MLLQAWIPKADYTQDDENPLSTTIGEEGDLLCAK
jgi:hypothetical protein